MDGRLVILLTQLAVADVAPRTFSLRKPPVRQEVQQAKRHLQTSGTGDYNYSYGTTGSGYGNASSGYGPYGYGGSGGESCAEQMCYTPVFTATGEPNWDVEGTVSCATWEAGCPCNQQWQVQCESYGLKTCELKSDGCYDPFQVTCNEETEVKCTDEYSAYCWEKQWGSCPVYCGSNQTTCYSVTYLSTGEVDYDVPIQETCADAAVGCTCDTQYETKCTDSSGYSWCTPKFEACPIECAEDQQVCYTMQYSANGEVDFTKPVEQSCVSMTSTCPCNTEFEDLCTFEDWSYCQPKALGSCPISCKENEQHCYATPYDSDGNVNYDAEWQESCVAAAGCPCDATWEKSCTMSEGGTSYSWCTFKDESCPIDCGTAVTCFHQSGNYSCATASGCTCEANENSCQDAAGIIECFAKEWYGETCPLICDYDTHNYCYEVGFDAQLAMIWTEYCHLRPSTNDWDCPVICKSDSAKKCGSGWDAYCIPLNEECPEECTSQQQLCVVPNYDASGNILSSPTKCVADGEECPCGDNTVKCTFEDWSYCESTGIGCPMTCAADEKLCDPISFTAAGEWDFSVASQQSCVKTDATCPCGANAKPCKWTDDWGYEEEYCVHESESCPVTCSEGQKRCYRTDFNSSGYPEAESEACVPQDQPCQCGTHSQTCHDPWIGGDVCYPMWDFWSNQKFTCPVVCATNEQYCFIPSYDAKGNWISTQESCVAQGQTCDCSQGQNAFTCTWNDPEWGSFAECLPTHGGYCPYSDCPQGQVSCSMVEDYLPNGTSLGWVQPSVKCATSADQCPCGKEAERCPNQGCIFKDEGCAQDCGTTEKKCYLTDYTADGTFISDRETCVPNDQPCPCGKNANKCANTDLCLPQSKLDLICPCKASQTSCPVVNYDKDGSLSGFMTVSCVKEGDACPCGKNTVSCPDPNDVTARFCVPTAQHKTCPQPCTAEAIAAGNKTCVRTNLDSNGEFKSQTVTCIGSSQRCTTGEGMKLCPSGQVIAVGTNCIDLYGGISTTRRLSTTTTAKRETCNAIITMTSLRSDAKKKVETTRVKISSVLQVPTQLRTTLAIKTATTAGRRLQTSTSTMIFGIDNQGVASTVSPSEVCEQLKKMVKSSSPSLTEAVSGLGVVNSQVGVNLDIATATLTSRSTAAVAQKQQQAGITVRTTTTGTPDQATSTLPGGFNAAPKLWPIPLTLCLVALTAY